MAHKRRLHTRQSPSTRFRPGNKATSIRGRRYLHRSTSLIFCAPVASVTELLLAYRPLRGRLREQGSAGLGTETLQDLEMREGMNVLMSLAGGDRVG